MEKLSERFFAPVLAWQQDSWHDVVAQYHAHRLPHGILAQGMTGIGKRAFVYRLAAWLLCQSKPDGGACGTCPSCCWLQAGTHPDLRLLPAEGEVIKIDEIRELSEFVAQKGNIRVIVLEHSDKMTLGSANALLKTLEEPTDGVFMLLISDNPSRLLPTIKSRVQSLPLAHFDTKIAKAYVENHLKDGELSADMLLALADFAPLRAMEIWQSAWFGCRKVWLQTFLALQTGKRTVVQASDYWQGVIGLDDFLILSQVMLTALYRHALSLPTLHSDLDFGGLQSIELSQQKLDNLHTVICDTKLSLTQNVQEKLAFDAILVAMAI